MMDLTHHLACLNHQQRGWGWPACKNQAWIFVQEHPTLATISTAGQAHRTAAIEEAGPPSAPITALSAHLCPTHSAGWGGWHPQAWFSAGVGAVCICTQSHSPGKRGKE